MKNITWIVAFLMFLTFVLYNAYKTDKAIKAKDEMISELEHEVRVMKLDKWADSIIKNQVGLFKKKLDSMYTARFTPPSP